MFKKMTQGKILQENEYIKINKMEILECKTKSEINNNRCDSRTDTAGERLVNRKIG